MGLRNAFEEIGLESTLRRILQAVSYSRDANDRMRILVDNQPAITLNNASTTTSVTAAALQPAHFGSNTWNIMDAREPMRDQSLMAFQIQRNRWTIT